MLKRSQKIEIIFLIITKQTICESVSTFETRPPDSYHILDIFYAYENEGIFIENSETKFQGQSAEIKTTRRLGFIVH